MALLVCADCGGKVSDSAMDCVHCGNVLQKQKPGLIGILLRVFYALFTIAVVVICLLATREALIYDTAAARLIPVIGFGIWFAGSISLAVLLYVTRHGRIERVDRAATLNPQPMKNEPTADNTAIRI